MKAPNNNNDNIYYKHLYELAVITVCSLSGLITYLSCFWNSALFSIWNRTVQTNPESGADPPQKTWNMDFSSSFLLQIMFFLTQSDPSLLDCVFYRQIWIGYLVLIHPPLLCLCEQWCRLVGLIRSFLTFTPVPGRRLFVLLRETDGSQSYLSFETIFVWNRALCPSQYIKVSPCHFFVTCLICLSLRLPCISAC